MSVRFLHLDTFNFIQTDEETWLFSGLSLIQNGYPESWTVFWESYGEYHWSRIGGVQEVVVRPYLDHPPLFQLLIGGWGMLTGNTGATPFDWKIIRIPMIVIAGLSIGMTTLLVKKIGTTGWAFFTLISFLFLPSHILTSRIIAAEHLIALCMTAVVVACYSYSTSQNIKQGQYKKYFLAVILLLSFLSPL